MFNKKRNIFQSFQEVDLVKPNGEPFKQCQKGLAKFYLKLTDPVFDYSKYPIIDKTLICYAFDTSLYKNPQRYRNSRSYRKVFEYLNICPYSMNQMSCDQASLICQILNNCINSFYFGHDQNIENLQNFLIEIWNKSRGSILSARLIQKYHSLIMSISIKFPYLLNINGVMLTFREFQQFEPSRQLFYSFLTTSIFYTKNYLNLQPYQIYFLLNHFATAVLDALKDEQIYTYEQIGMVYSTILNSLMDERNPLRAEHAFYQNLNKNLVHWTCIRKNESVIFRDWTRYLLSQIRPDNKFKHNDIYKIIVDNFHLICQKKCMKEIIQSQIIQLLQKDEQLCLHFLFKLQKLQQANQNPNKTIFVDLLLDNPQTSIMLFIILRKSFEYYIKQDGLTQGQKVTQCDRVYKFFFQIKCGRKMLMDELSLHFEEASFRQAFNQFMYLLHQTYLGGKEQLDQFTYMLKCSHYNQKVSQQSPQYSQYCRQYEI